MWGSVTVTDRQLDSALNALCQVLPISGRSFLLDPLTSRDLLRSKTINKSSLQRRLSLPEQWLEPSSRILIDKGSIARLQADRAPCLATNKRLHSLRFKAAQNPSGSSVADKHVIGSFVWGVTSNRKRLCLHEPLWPASSHIQGRGDTKNCGKQLEAGGRGRD